LCSIKAVNSSREEIKSRGNPSVLWLPESMLGKIDKIGKTPPSSTTWQEDG